MLFIAENAAIPHVAAAQYRVDISWVGV